MTCYQPVCHCHNTLTPQRPKLMVRKKKQFSPDINNRNTVFGGGFVSSPIMTHVPLSREIPAPSPRPGTALSRMSPLVCPLAKLGRASPSLDQSYHHKIGRASPSLDQGYHTLVPPSPGPSPGPWTDHLLATFKGKRLHKSSPFERLTDELVVKIFSYLTTSELCACARVCRRWHCLAWEPQLWTSVTLSGEGISGDRAIKSILRLLGRGSASACATIERVEVSGGAWMTDRGLSLLTARCPELTHLTVHGCTGVTNSAIFDMATKCTNLEHLDVTGCTRISCISMNPALEMGLERPSPLFLQYLDLTDCHSVEDAGLKIIVRNCPQLVYLYLRRCVQITDAGVKCVPSYCVMLRELSVSDCVQVTDFGMYELAKLGPNLRYLSVAKCDQVSDAGLKQIARHCYKLRYLNARGCEAVSDDSLSVLARSCPRLRALDIGKCDVTDHGLKVLAESCPNLKKLSVKSCDMVTDQGIQCIAYYCRGLQQLNIQDCQVTIEGYRAVKKYCKRCIIEHTNPGFF